MAVAGARAGNRLDPTRTDALLPPLETGKIYCVRHLLRPSSLLWPVATRRVRAANVERANRFGPGKMLEAISSKPERA